MSIAPLPSIVRLAPILALLVSGCASDPPRLLVLISIDTLRPDHLGAYGYERATSPLLDAVAAVGVLFADVTTTSPWTLPAHASLLTGLYPNRHGVRSTGAVLPAEVATLAAELSAHSFRTAAIVNSVYLKREQGFDRGFDEYLYVRELVSQREPSRLITDRAVQWLERHGDGPAFLFLHYYDVHSDYASLPAYEASFARSYRGRADGTTRQLLRWRHGQETSVRPSDADHLRDLYDAGIRQLDDELGRLFEFLAASGLADATLLAITSDHGEEFFEHGGVLHGLTQYRELVRVPWLLRGPGVPAGRRIEEPVSLVDVVPTLMSALAVPAPAGLDGLDLTRLWNGDGRLPERTLFSGADHNKRPPDATASARRGRFCLHLDRPSGRLALYDLARDPGEKTDVAAQEPDVVSRLRAELAEREGGARAVAPRRELAPEEIEGLRSLGYLE